MEKNQKSENLTIDQLREISQSLKDVRRQKGLTLREVERISEGKWKAVVIGSYERMDRALTLKRALELARFYELPLAQLLGLSRGNSLHSNSEGDAVARELRLDLRRLRSTPEFEVSALGRFISSICQERQDWNGEVLTLRRGDHLAISALCGAPEGELIDWFEKRGVLFKSRVRA